MKKFLLAAMVLVVPALVHAGMLDSGVDKGKRVEYFTVTISSTPTAILTSDQLQYCTDYDYVGISGSTFYTKSSADLDTAAADVGTVAIHTPVSPGGKNTAPVYGATEKGTANTTVITGHIYKD